MQPANRFTEVHYLIYPRVMQPATVLDASGCMISRGEKFSLPENTFNMVEKIDGNRLLS
jgi:hypothetical protein